MTAKIRFETEGELGLITFDDPPFNVFDEQHWQEAIVAVKRATRSGLRALLIRANGPNFSRGAALPLFHERSAEQARAMIEQYSAVTHGLENAPFPVVAAVRGLCFVSGLEIALACDLIIASETTRFSQTEAIVGVTTLLGGAQRLARRCGDARAREILYTNDMFDAPTFERWSIINRVVSDETLDDEALKLARRLAAGPTLAHRATKKLIRLVDAAGLEAAEAAVLSDAVTLFESEDMRGAVRQLLNVDRAQARTVAINFRGH
jgi:enoyl-CoA hydratase/carnithine racemase